MGKNRYALYMDFSSEREMDQLKRFFVLAAAKAGVELHFANVKKKKSARPAGSQQELMGILSRAKGRLTLQQIQERRKFEVAKSPTFRTLARMATNGQISKGYDEDAVKYWIE